MRRYSPPYYSPPRRGYGSPPRRGYGGRPRSPPRRGHGGERGRHKEQNNGSLLVRNIPLDCRPEELRVPFERFGLVRDVYLPKNYYTGEPRGFAFVQFVDAYDAAEAQNHMNGQIFAGREISVVLAAETRKRPEEMRRRARVRGPSSYDGRRSSYYGRSRSRSWSRSRSRSPRYPSGSRSRYRSRSYSPAPKRRSDHSMSPVRRDRRSPRGPPLERESDHAHRSYSPRYEGGADHNVNRGPPLERESGRARRSYSPRYDGGADQNVNRRSPYASDGERAWYGTSPGPRQASRSPSGSRSRSADPSPPRG